MLIPLLDSNLEIIGNTEFVDNLTRKDVPDYLNFNGRIGLKRLNTDGKVNDGLLVFMVYDEKYPSRSYAEIITPLEAYKMCLVREKLDLATELNIKVNLEREVL